MSDPVIAISRTGAISIAGLLIVFAGFSGWTVVSSSRPLSATTAATSTIDIPPAPTSTIMHVAMPKEVRGIYWTAETAAGKRANELLSYMEAQGLNTVVIDVGMDDGEIAFVTQDPSLHPYQQDEPAIKDLDGLLRRIGEKNVYRIARIPVMKNSALASAVPFIALRTSKGNPWRDRIGAMWVDPSAPEVAEYALAVAREAYRRGFDEVQFDYVRFPSDGSVSSIVYPRFDKKKETMANAMNRFFQSVAQPLHDQGIPVSLDVFGITFWNPDDNHIGQRLHDTFAAADFVSPMVYPSHYPVGFKGYGNPALFPYDIVKRSLDEGAAQLEREQHVSSTVSRPKFRPWLQDFNMGAVYNEARVEAQIKAARDAGASGWLLWNARNVYEPHLSIK